jgi:hypothetical protein
MVSMPTFPALVVLPQEPPQSPDYEDHDGGPVPPRVAEEPP